MTIVASILLIVGFLICLIFGIQLLILAFQKSVLWGLGYIFVPFCSLVFVIMHWSETKTPFLRMLLAFPLLIAGGMLMPQTQTM